MILATHLVLACLWLLLAAATVGAQTLAPAPLETLELDEWFGVRHCEQIVELPLRTAGIAGAGRLLDAAGRSVPFQVVDRGRKLAVRTDLPAAARLHWTWDRTADRTADRAARAAPAPPHAVTITPTTDGFEIANGLVAVRVPGREAILACRDLMTGSLPPSPASAPHVGFGSATGGQARSAVAAELSA